MTTFNLSLTTKATWCVQYGKLLSYQDNHYQPLDFIYKFSLLFLNQHNSCKYIAFCLIDELKMIRSVKKSCYCNVLYTR